MKLMISKNKEGNGYYTKITNEYNNEKLETYLSIQLPKGKELEYGLYNVDGFFSCYKAKDGTVKPKFIVMYAEPTQKYEKKEEVKQETTEEYDPFSEFGESIEITDNFLD